MTIKTWQEREFDAYGYVAVSSACNAPYMQQEIDELRAELDKANAQNQRYLDNLGTCWQEIKTEQRLSFRSQVDELRAKLAEHEAVASRLESLIAANEKLQARLNKRQAELEIPPTPPFGDVRKAAMAIYAPPFKHLHGYIYDSRDKMVADNGEIAGEQSIKAAVASRVRGWGRIGYMPNAKQLQDEIGAMMADALNAMYLAAGAKDRNSTPTPSKSFAETHPANPDAKCKCEHCQACKECHPTAFEGAKP